MVKRRLGTLKSNYFYSLNIRLLGKWQKTDFLLKIRFFILFEMCSTIKSPCSNTVVVHFSLIIKLTKPTEWNTFELSPSLNQSSFGKYFHRLLYFKRDSVYRFATPQSDWQHLLANINQRATLYERLNQTLNASKEFTEQKLYSDSGDVSDNILSAHRTNPVLRVSFIKFHSRKSNPNNCLPW